jgi:hypothetical protein
MEYSIFPGKFLIGFSDGTSLLFDIFVDNDGWQVVSHG